MDTFLAREVQFVADLAIGQPENSIQSDIETIKQREEFANALRAHTVQLTATNTADCMDERTTVKLGDGTTDKEVLKQRVANQLPGGLVLASTKAAVAANAAFLGDTKSFQDAYETTYKLLTEMGYEDGGHAHCGASKFVEESVAHPVVPEIALPTLGAIFEINETRENAFHKNAQTTRERVADGFYAGWSPTWHEAFLADHVPHNFSYVSDVHNADGIFLVTQKGAGFAKNAFTEDTGQESFGITVPAMFELAQKLGGSEEERDRILIGFGTDLLDVSDKLIAPNLPAFADAA